MTSMDSKGCVMRQLSQQTVSLINSGQVITSVSAAVKELIENAVDAGASSIEVRLENHGLAKIQVRDDGSGVRKEDIHLMPLKSFTSKIEQFSDINNVTSYGFRGEALHALATVSDLVITSKTKADMTATAVAFDQKGQPTNASTLAATQGTQITVSNLFSNIPVRRSYAQKGNRPKEELKKVEQVVTSFALICHNLRITLYHNNKQLFVKSRASSLEQSLALTFGQPCFKTLHCLAGDLFTVYTPKKNHSDTSKSVQQGAYVFVNSRPVVDKKIEKVLRECVAVKSAAPVIVCLNLPTDDLDVNLDPSKYSVFYAKQTEVVDRLKCALKDYYHEEEEVVSPAGDSPSIETVKEKVSSDEIIRTSGNGGKSVPLSTIGKNPDVVANNVFKPHPSPEDESILFKTPTQSQNWSGKDKIETASANRLRCLDGSQDERAAFQKSFEKENQGLFSQILSPPSSGPPSSGPPKPKDVERSWAKGNLLTRSQSRTVSPIQMLTKQPTISSSFDASFDVSAYLNQESANKKRRSPSDVEMQMDAMEKSAAGRKKKLDDDDDFLPADTRRISEIFKPISSVKAVKDKQKARDGVGNATLEALAAPECTPRINEVDNLQSPKKKRKITRRCINLTFSADQLASECDVTRGNPSTNDGTVVGQLKPSGFWVVLKGGGLKIVNHHRAQEIAIFHSLMESYSFPVQHEFKPAMEPSCHPKWSPALETTLASMVVSEDPRLALNGFRLDEAGRLTGAWDATSGLEDLVNVVGCVAMSPDEEVGVQDVRPLKFKTFLEGEAVRMQRQVPPSMSRLEIHRMVESTTALTQATQNDDEGVCLHGKQIYSDPLYNFK